MDPTVDLARQRASTLHAGQEREWPIGETYFCHVAEVARLIEEVDGRPEMTAAAWLHDTLEHTAYAGEELQSEFGPTIARLVQELTRSEPEPNAALSKDEWRELRSRLLLEDIARMSPDAQIIKLCDRLSNLQEKLASRTGPRRERYLIQTRAILDLIPRERSTRIWDTIDRLLRENS